MSNEMENEEIKIGSRVKIKENASYFEGSYFDDDERSYPSSLKRRVGIVVDDAGDDDDDVLVLFPGWSEGHDGGVYSKSGKRFGNNHLGGTSACWYVLLNDLQIVHDGFEIGDRVEAVICDNTLTGKIVDYNKNSGVPLIDFSESKGTEGWEVVSKWFHNGSLYSVIGAFTLLHSSNCYYCPYSLLTSIEPNSELCGKNNVEKDDQAEYLKDNEEIKIGSRVKIKEDYFDKGFYPLSLKGRVGIVVDNTIDGRVTVLFPGWDVGHNGVFFSKSGRSFGNAIDTCQDLPLNVLEVVHDGFEIGDAVILHTPDGSKKGKIVDFFSLTGIPLVEFSDSDATDFMGLTLHDGNEFCVTNTHHPNKCYYCDYAGPKAPFGLYKISSDF